MVDEVVDLLAEDFRQPLGSVGGREDVSLEGEALDHEHDLPARRGPSGFAEARGHVIGGLLEMVAALGDLLGEKPEEVGKGARRKDRHAGRRVDLAGERLDLVPLARGGGSCSGCPGPLRLGRRWRWRLGFAGGDGHLVVEEREEQPFVDLAVGKGAILVAEIGRRIDHRRLALRPQALQRRREVGIGGKQDELVIGPVRASQSMASRTICSPAELR